MPEEVTGILEKTRVGVVAIAIADGTPHAAAVHIAYTRDPFTLVFLTTRASKKVGALASGSSPASFVVGNDEANMRTLQLDGTTAFTEDTTLMELYFERYPARREKYDAERDVFVAFTPSFWRYTDMLAPGGRLILSSE